MNKERMDKEFPDIVLDIDDRQSFQRTSQTSKDKSGATTRESSKSGGSGIWLFLTLLIAASSAGASYWLFTEKLAADANLSNAIGRVAELERRLSATGEEMDQSAGALRVTVSELTDKTDELWTQMDKLWASAWRKNQSDITQVAQDQKQQANDFNKKINVFNSEVVSLSTSLAVIQEQLAQHSNDVSLLKSRQSELAKNGSEQKRSINDLNAKVEALEQVNKALTRRVAELEKWRREVSAVP